MLKLNTTANPIPETTLYPSQALLGHLDYQNLHFARHAKGNHHEEQPKSRVFFRVQVSLSLQAQELRIVARTHRNAPPVPRPVRESSQVELIGVGVPKPETPKAYSKP